jgi:hypothetical protein
VRGNRVVASCLVIGVVLSGGLQADQSVGERRLNPAIGPPNTAKYKSITDAQDWLNPYVSVCRQDVVLTVRSVKQVTDIVSLEIFRKVLLDLPVTAWPYGRVVALQDCSLGSRGDVGDRKTWMLKVQEVLDTLGLETSRWPS